jgi:hypothetical protein
VLKVLKTPAGAPTLAHHDIFRSLVTPVTGASLQRLQVEIRQMEEAHGISTEQQAEWVDGQPLFQAALNSVAQREVDRWAHGAGFLGRFLGQGLEGKGGEGGFAGR